MDEDSLLDALLGDSEPLPAVPLEIAPPVNPPPVTPPPVTPPSVTPPSVPSKPRIQFIFDQKTTVPGTFVSRRRFGGYQPPQKIVPTVVLPERIIEVIYDLNTERIHLRAKQKRDDRIKEKKKEK